ncbi:hypothetical protein [Muricomes intestini]|jgi:hypothetical protein|uniref:hypothetical protein n=1 Tax=Muricomes intestini TaxID=1796634 RepID=UPI0026C0CA40
MKSFDIKIPWEATLTDWCIVLYPQIYDHTENPLSVFAKLNCGQPVALFGRAKSDPRYNAETGAFTDGHRLVTSPIVSVKDGKYNTQDTIYSVDEDDKNPDFKIWCEESQYSEVSLNVVSEMNGAKDNTIIRHICENCGKEEVLCSEDGFNQGWDYPPKMGAFKVISPRTCGDCGIQTTLWWEITCNKTPPDQLNARHQETLKRILTEPESILP